MFLSFYNSLIYTHTFTYTHTHTHTHTHTQSRKADFENMVRGMRRDYERSLRDKIMRARQRKHDKEEREAKQNRQMEQIRKFEEERLKQARLDRERYEAEVASRYVHIYIHTYIYTHSVWW